MAFRHLGGSPKKAVPGEMLLVVRECPPLSPLSPMTGADLPHLIYLRLGGLVLSKINAYFAMINLNDSENRVSLLTAIPIDDFEARSPDELSLFKGDRIELIERDDDFGDGWYLGKHVQNGRTGLFPEGEISAV